MPASRADLSAWFDTAKSEGATHLMVFCDTYESGSDCCYPVFVMPGDSPRDRLDKSNPSFNADQLKECYSMALPKDDQMAERYAIHLD